MRLAQSYKYCPNCAYRLRPDLAPDTPAPPKPAATLAERLVALGGYLAFASILLLVTLVGFRLFDRPAPPPATTTQIVRPRNAAATPVTFASVDPGEVLYGLYDERSYRSGEESAPPKVLAENWVDDGFRMAVHEITNDQYYEFLDAWTRRARRAVPRWMYPDDWRNETGNPDLSVTYPPSDSDSPVTGVSFAAAREYCAWYWEAKLDRDPDRIVDLPTWLEYLCAARPGLDYNFPWGESLNFDSPVNLSGRVWPVQAAGKHGRFFGLVGNAAEWVHGWGEHPLAAGWSWQNREYMAAWEAPDGPRPTPFGDSGFRTVTRGLAEPDVGFRIVIRNAPAEPDFRHEVEAGTVRFGSPHPDLRPPVDEAALLDEEDGNGNDSSEEESPDEREAVERELPRLPPVTFSPAVREVGRRFRIGRTPVTNRQYLAFLVDLAANGKSAKDLRPVSWTTRHPFRRPKVWGPAQFRGPFGPPAGVRFVYVPGDANLPVVGVTVEQANAYARWLSRRLDCTCRLPTAAEYVRAARGDGTRPYPWGTEPGDPALFSAENSRGRPVSIAGWLGPAAGPVTGLVGNVCQYVTDGPRTLLAGGFYRLPARLCTIDTFLDPGWGTRDRLASVSFRQETEDGEGRVAGPFVLRSHAGFRLVVVRELP